MLVERLVRVHHNVLDVHFEIVDVDNKFGYGAGTVLDRFGDSWYLVNSQECQGDIMVPYPAKIAAGLYIRIVYHSIGASPVNVHANFYLHKKT